VKSYPLFRQENLPAYSTVMSAGGIVSVASAAALVVVTDSRLFSVALVWAAATTMAGMAIMFVAGVINLRKLAPGFRRLAEGERNASIPPVWYPVLTAASNAAAELASNNFELAIMEDFCLPTSIRDPV